MKSEQRKTAEQLTANGLMVSGAEAPFHEAALLLRRLGQDLVHPRLDSAFTIGG